MVVNVSKFIVSQILSCIEIYHISKFIMYQVSLSMYQNSLYLKIYHISSFIRNISKFIMYQVSLRICQNTMCTKNYQVSIFVIHCIPQFIMHKINSLWIKIYRVSSFIINVSISVVHQIYYVPRFIMYQKK